MSWYAGVYLGHSNHFHCFAGISVWLVKEKEQSEGLGLITKYCWYVVAYSDTPCPLSLTKKNFPCVHVGNFHSRDSKESGFITSPLSGVPFFKMVFRMRMLLTFCRSFLCSVKLWKLKPTTVFKSLWQKSTFSPFPNPIRRWSVPSGSKPQQFYSCHPLV